MLMQFYGKDSANNQYIAKEIKKQKNSEIKK